MKFIINEKLKLDVIGLPKVYSTSYAKRKQKELESMGINTVVIEDKFLSNTSILHKL